MNRFYDFNPEGNDDTGGLRNIDRRSFPLNTKLHIVIRIGQSRVRAILNINPSKKNTIPRVPTVDLLNKGKEPTDSECTKLIGVDKCFLGKNMELDTGLSAPMVFLLDEGVKLTANERRLLHFLHKAKKDGIFKKGFFIALQLYNLSGENIIRLKEHGYIIQKNNRYYHRDFAGLDELTEIQQKLLAFIRQSGEKGKTFAEIIDEAELFEFFSEGLFDDLDSTTDNTASMENLISKGLIKRRKKDDKYVHRDFY